MEVSYANAKLKKRLTEPKSLYQTYGQLARKLNQRISELNTVENLEIMRKLPAAGCHELSGNRKGQFAVIVSNNYRLIFKPDQLPVPRKKDGSLHWAKVNKIIIIEIVDYH
jgi:plasmid maintenance system killer protein